MRVLKKSENIYDCNDKTYYHGSYSIANKEYWPFYSKHKKEIICWCDSIEELRQKEMEIIDLQISKFRKIQTSLALYMNELRYL